MKKRHLKWALFAVWAVLLLSCGTRTSPPESVDLPTKSKEEKLVHLVFLSTTEEARSDTVRKQLISLGKIPSVQQLEVGTFASMGDDRALFDYEWVVQMRFADTAAYRSYQRHPIHLELKKQLQPMLDAPPATYDYWETSR